MILTSSFLTNLFNTFAQVSFTVAGLLVLAIAGDSNQRTYWFGNEARSVYARQTILILLLPGFISLGGVIPPLTENSIPTWPFSAGLFGLIYLLLAIDYRIRRRKLHDPSEYRRLVTMFSNVNTEMAFFGSSSLFVAILGYFSYRALEQVQYGIFEIALGIFFSTSVVTGALASIAFLKLSKEVDNPESNIQTNENTEILDASTNVDSNGLLYALASIIVALFFFMLGLIINIRGDKN